ncbi:MAG: hypothetical protein KIT27_09165 [Legionellales bacterium]|nr:hypothetical protein [Legionellales bacterium]
MKNVLWKRDSIRSRKILHPQFAQISHSVSFRQYIQEFLESKTRNRLLNIILNGIWAFIAMFRQLLEILTALNLLRSLIEPFLRYQDTKDNHERKKIMREFAISITIAIALVALVIFAPYSIPLLGIITKIGGFLVPQLIELGIGGAVYLGIKKTFDFFKNHKSHQENLISDQDLVLTAEQEAQLSEHDYFHILKSELVFEYNKCHHFNGLGPVRFQHEWRAKRAKQALLDLKNGYCMTAREIFETRLDECVEEIEAIDRELIFNTLNEEMQQIELD